MVPDIGKQEWGKLITGEAKVKNFALQMKLNALRQHYKLKKIELREAKINLREFCMNNESMIANDLESIFEK
jgi:hypothetical protein